MIRFLGSVLLVAALMGQSCQKNKNDGCDLPGEWMVLKAAVDNEVKQNAANGLGVNRNITKGETVSNEAEDSVDWKSELKLFSEMFTMAGCFCKGMNATVDSLNGLMIKEWTTSDTTCRIQRVKWVLKNDKTELIEVAQRQRGWVVDRDIDLTLQPGKGYRILLREDYLWSKPGEKEIFSNYITEGR